MKTPGGGGYGSAEHKSAAAIDEENESNQLFTERGSVFEYRMIQESV
jgi:N-methylhydantoinase B/oxoprolinase/acetone carboxylase alpha subunit